MDNNFKRAITEMQKRKALADKESSKKRLMTHIEKKFKTTTIGCLALIEEHFGELWAHRENRSLTPEEQDWLERWKILRAEILDKGNFQMRAAMNEISEYTLNWEKYRMTFLPASLTKKED